MNFERIYPKKSKLLKLFSIYSIVLLLLIYGLFSSRFGWAYQDPSMIPSCIFQDVICIIIWIVISIASYLIFTKQNYYVILKDGIVHHKRTKEVKYTYEEILYIDEEYTKKHETLLFYTSKGRPIYLVMDKDEKIFNSIKKHAKNLMTKQDYHNKFPNVSL